jgi:hypothetical protein
MCPNNPVRSYTSSLMEKYVMTEQPPHLSKPLCRLQAFLKELKTVIKLSTNVLIELKKLLVIATLILFFILGVWEELRRAGFPTPHFSMSSQRSP